jgi:hypothetical protein
MASELLESPLMAEAENEAKGLPAKRPRGNRNVHGLTEMEESFALHFAKSRDGVAALKAAGYTTPKGTFLNWKVKQMLEKPAIAHRIREINNIAAVDIAVTREIFHQKILMVYQKALEDGDYKAANAAMELIGKSLNYFVEQKANLNISANMTGTSSEDRLKNLTELAAKVGLTLATK